MKLSTLAGLRALAFSCAAMCGVVTATLGFTSSASAQPQLTELKIQDYPGIGNMLARIAASKGYCEKHGIKCQLQVIPSGPLGAQALLANSIQVGYFPPEVQIGAVVKGAELKAIAAGATLNVFLLVIRNELAAPNAEKGYPAFMADLKGKKIGVPARGAGGELQFRLLVKNAGLKEDDFTFVAVGGPDTSYGALTSGQIDASMTFEPSGSMCTVLKTCRMIYRGSESPEPAQIARTNGASSNLVVNNEMIEKSPKAVNGLIAAMKEAEVFIQDPKNFAEALTIAKTYFQFKFPQGDEVMETSLRLAIPAYKASITRSAVQQIADNMFEMKQIPTKYDTSKLVYDKAP